MLEGFRLLQNTRWRFVEYAFKRKYWSAFQDFHCQPRWRGAILTTYRGTMDDADKKAYTPEGICRCCNYVRDSMADAFVAELQKFAEKQEFGEE